MSFEPLGDFLVMGHHGPYVWLTYGISLLVLAINVVEPLLIRRRCPQEEARCLRREVRQ